MDLSIYVNTIRFRRDPAENGAALTNDVLYQISTANLDNLSISAHRQQTMSLICDKISTILDLIFIQFTIKALIYLIVFLSKFKILIKRKLFKNLITNYMNIQMTTMIGTEFAPKVFQ